MIIMKEDIARLVRQENCNHIMGVTTKQHRGWMIYTSDKEWQTERKMAEYKCRFCPECGEEIKK